MNLPIAVPIVTAVKISEEILNGEPLIPKQESESEFNARIEQEAFNMPTKPGENDFGEFELE